MKGYIKFVGQCSSTLWATQRHFTGQIRTHLPCFPTWHQSNTCLRCIVRPSWLGVEYMLCTWLLRYRLGRLLSQEARGVRSPLAAFFSVSLIRSVTTYFAMIWRIPQSVNFCVTVNVTRPTEQRLSAGSYRSGEVLVGEESQPSNRSCCLFQLMEGLKAQQLRSHLRRLLFPLLQ